MRVISTRAKGWQKKCWELTQAGAEIEIPDITPKHLLFLQELCAAYHCKHKLVGNTLHLSFPQSPKQKMNDELEPEIKKLLRTIAEAKTEPQKELVDLCIRSISRCLEKENLSPRSIEVLERMLDVLEISVAEERRGDFLPR